MWSPELKPQDCQSEKQTNPCTNDTVQGIGDDTDFWHQENDIKNIEEQNRDQKFKIS
jgi:hypothetical protein